jgi:hypothetical protein
MGEGREGDESTKGINERRKEVRYEKRNYYAWDFSWNFQLLL